LFFAHEHWLIFNPLDVQELLLPALLLLLRHAIGLEVAVSPILFIARCRHEIFLAQDRVIWSADRIVDILVLTLFLGVEYVAYSTFAVLVLPFLSLDAAISFLVHFLSTVASLTHASDLLIAILHNIGDGRVAGLCQAPTKAISTYNMSQPICEKSNQNMSHIQLALQAIEGDATLSLTRAARIYKVPERTLRRRCDGTSS
jgi:hypothetical protein